MSTEPGDRAEPATTAQHTDADVCVIGAGPAGLALALLLLRSGVRVALLERSSGFRRAFRGEILQPGGLAVLDALGVLAAARERGSWAHTGFQLVDGERTLLDIDYRRLGPPYDHLLAVDQRHVLEELLAACRRHPGFAYFGGHRLMELLTEDGRFTGAVGEHATGRRCSVHASVLVGADGRYSKTRLLAGIGQQRMDVFAQDVVWFRLHAPDTVPDRVRVHRSAGQAFLVHGSHPGMVQIGWTVPHHGWKAIAARGIDQVREEIAAALPAYAAPVREQLTAMRDLTLLDVFAGRAESWVRDGLVLIGDAAHTHSPLGAQGINLALQDAAVLHPVLLDVLHGDPDSPDARRALHRFTELRSAGIDAVFRFQVTQAKAMLGRPNPVADTVRPVLAGLVQRTPLGAFLTRRIARGRTPVPVRTDLFTAPRPRDPRFPHPAEPPKGPTMTDTTVRTTTTAASALHTEVEHFYARQMQLLDRHACEEWADTFTVDGVFDANGLPEPAKGREAIAAGARAATSRLVTEGLVHRHWLGMLTVDEQPDGTVAARSYALVIQTEQGGASVLHRSTVCEDLLVRADDGSLRVRDRKVTRDDIA